MATEVPQELLNEIKSFVDKTQNFINTEKQRRSSTGGTVQRAQPFTPVQRTSTRETVDAGILGNTQPFTLPSQTRQSGFSDLSDSVNAISQQFLATNQQEIQRLQSQQNQGNEFLADVFDRLGNIEKTRADLFEDSGVNDIRKEVDALSSQIEQRGLAARRQIEDLVDNNPEGLFGGALQQEVDKISRLAAREQADLAIVLSAKTRQYDTASSIIDQRIKAETQALETQVDGMKFFLQQNQSQLSTAQQNQINERIRLQERVLEDERERQKTIGQVQLEAARNGAPVNIVSQIGDANNQIEAISLASQYLVDPAQELKLENLRLQNMKIRQDMSNRAVEDAQEAAEQEKVNAAKADKALEMKFLLQSIKDHPGLNNAVGPNALARGFNPLTGFDAGSRLLTGSRSDFISDVERAANTLTLENMELLKGPATDKDVQIVAASMSKLLNRDVTESSYKEELDRIIAASDRIIQEVGVTEEQESFYYNNMSSGEMEEVSAIYNGIAGNSESTKAFNASDWY